MLDTMNELRLIAFFFAAWLMRLSRSDGMRASRPELP